MAFKWLALSMVVSLGVLVSPIFLTSHLNQKGYQTLHVKSEFSSESAVAEKNIVSIEDLWETYLGNKTYIKGVYDCTEFSNDFSDILNRHNISNRIVYGHYLNDDCAYGSCFHCWLEIGNRTFEPQHGYFPKNTSKYDKKRYVDFCF